MQVQLFTRPGSERSRGPWLGPAAEGEQADSTKKPTVSCALYFCGRADRDCASSAMDKACDGWSDVELTTPAQAIDDAGLEFLLQGLDSA